MTTVPSVEDPNNPKQRFDHMAELVATHGAKSHEAKTEWPSVREIAIQYADPDPKGGGSQNHNVAGMVLLAAMEPGEGAGHWSKFYEYCRVQVAGDGLATGGAGLYVHRAAHSGGQGHGLPPFVAARRLKFHAPGADHGLEH